VNSLFTPAVFGQFTPATAVNNNPAGISLFFYSYLKKGGVTLPIMCYAGR
jgi:hypothetical protein